MTQHTDQKYLRLLIVLMFASCGGEAVPLADEAQIIGLIQQDAQAIANNPNITNDLALIDMEGRTNLDPNQGDIFANAALSPEVAVEPPVEMQEIRPMMEEPIMAAEAAPPMVRKPAASMQAAVRTTSIKVGNDRNGQRVSPRSSQKITTVIQTGKAVFADIHLFAVPAGSPRPVRNNNTLIGFAKNFDTARGQVQFTRYWNASTARGVYLSPGLYHIYFTYTLKNGNMREISSGGRYWGGSNPMSIRVQ